MSEAIQLVPNKWVSEEVLMAITGLTKNAIKSHVRSHGWRVRSIGTTPATASPRITPLSSITGTKSMRGVSVSARRFPARNLLKYPSPSTNKESL